MDIEGFPLGHVEAPANVEEKKLVEPLFDRLLGEVNEIELMADDRKFESSHVFDDLGSRKISGVILWRRLKEHVNPSDVLSMKNRLNVEGHEHLRMVYKC